MRLFNSRYKSPSPQTIFITLLAFFAGVLYCRYVEQCGKSVSNTTNDTLDKFDRFCLREGVSGLHKDSDPNLVILSHCISNMKKMATDPLTGDTLLIKAVRFGSIEELKKCLRANFDFRSQDFKGKTALIWAVELQNLEKTKLILDAMLLERGHFFEIFSREDKQGRSAYSYSFKNPKLEALMSEAADKYQNIFEQGHTSNRLTL